MPTLSLTIPLGASSVQFTLTPGMIGQREISFSSNPPLNLPAPLLLTVLGQQLTYTVSLDYPALLGPVAITITDSDATGTDILAATT